MINLLENDGKPMYIYPTLKGCQRREDGKRGRESPGLGNVKYTPN